MGMAKSHLILLFGNDEVSRYCFIFSFLASCSRDGGPSVVKYMDEKRAAVLYNILEAREWRVKQESPCLMVLSMRCSFSVLYWNIYFPNKQKVVYGLS